MNVFEFRNLLASEDRKEKRKSLQRSLIKSVETGANGTQDYVVKKGPGKNKIATTRQYFLTTIIHVELYWVWCVFEIMYFLKF